MKLYLVMILESSYVYMVFSQFSSILVSFLSVSSDCQIGNLSNMCGLSDFPPWSWWTLTQAREGVPSVFSTSGSLLFKLSNEDNTDPGSYPTWTTVTFILAICSRQLRSGEFLCHNHGLTINILSLRLRLFFVLGFHVVNTS
jgi:hypothetical protein